MKKLICFISIMLFVTLAFGQQPETFVQKVNSSTSIELFDGNKITGDPTAKVGTAYLYGDFVEDGTWAATAYTDVFSFEAWTGLPVKLGAGTIILDGLGKVCPAAFVNYEFQAYRWSNLVQGLNRVIPFLDPDDLVFDLGIVGAADEISDDPEFVYGIQTSLSISF